MYMKIPVTKSLPTLAVNSVWWAETATLSVCGKLWHLGHHADGQAAHHVQCQDRVARLAEILAKITQQLTTLCVVKSETSALVVEECSHPLRYLRDKHAGANVSVQQLVPAAGETREDKQVIPKWRIFYILFIIFWILHIQNYATCMYDWITLLIDFNYCLLWLYYDRYHF